MKHRSGLTLTLSLVRSNDSTLLVRRWHLLGQFQLKSKGYTTQTQTRYGHGVKYFSELRESVQSAKSDPLANLGAYLNEHNRNLLVVDDANDKRTGLTKAPLKIPYGPLMTRYEPDTGLLWIAIDPLRIWCTQKQIGFKDITDGIKALDPNSIIKKKGMAKGSELDTFSVNALGFSVEKVKIKFNIPTEE